MSARKIRGHWYVDLRYDGRRFRKRSPENSRPGALAYEATLRARLARGEPLVPPPQRPPPPRFEEFAWRWFQTYVQANNKLSEQKAKKVTLDAHLIPAFGKLPLDRITPIVVEEYKARTLRSGLSAKTVNNHLTILHRCLRSANEWHDVAIPRIAKLKVPPSGFDFLTEEESRRLLGAIENPFWHTMVLVALRTGLRHGELLGLQWHDVDLAGRVLTVRRSVVRGVIGSPKSNRERKVPLIPQVCHALLAMAREQPFVFGRSAGRPLHHETPRTTLKRYCKAAGLRPIGWHVLRHTFASQLVAKGASVKAVQDLLGHSDIQMTMRYTHLAPSALYEAVQLLEPVPVPPPFGQRVGNAVFPSLVGNQKRA